MKTERWRRIDDLFAAALELEGSPRQRYLDEQCAGDDALRAEVESMLRFARVSENFLETPAIIDGAAMTAVVSEVATQPRHAMDNSRFIPGDVVAGRYRIVGLLGRGGMGEVYRADDLKLGQPVALKFLAESLATNGAALARFHREVSLARQISHRHVCRVYDIGEHAGMHFLSMEYVRGEELSSLLKRIGRLPLDKAQETARQLCAGLAAIHAAGVLHRDLKPANVMIDEHGDVRITDFGVAALSEGVSGREAMIGTPVYMSPEQLTGGELTIRSDLYALGLVLYEAFTGNRPFAATALPDIVRDRLGDTTPTSPSSWITDLHPLVERVILRCLEKDPEQRPATALQVAAALPGGDPLAAALAAGETPSPQMVAAAGTQGSLRPLMATLLLAAILAGMVIVALLSTRTALHRMVPLELSPEVLRVRAEDVAREAGYGAPPADTASGFREDREVVRFAATQPIPAKAGEAVPDRWERFRRAPLPAIVFWYRRSPLPLVPYNLGQVLPADPPNEISGMVSMRFDTMGRLLYFEAAPGQADAAGMRSRTADWPRLFERAGLTMSAFRTATPRWTPPHHGDERHSWTGVHPQRPDLPLRIEAAAYRGAPVWFEVVWPWQKPEREPGSVPEPADGNFSISLLLLYFGAMAVAALLAWKNVRLGRGDRRGTFRVMLFVFFTRLVHWLFVTHHVATLHEVGLFVSGLQSAVYWAASLGLFYLALEPFIRRRWPEWLISWTRFLNGDMRNPLVGRDVLIGGVLGLGVILANHLILVVPPLLGRPMIAPSVNSDLLYTYGLAGAGGFVPLLLNQTAASFLFPVIVISLVLFLAMITRRNRVAIAVSWLLLYVALNFNFSYGTLLGYLLGVALPTILIVALTRFGLLAMMAMFFFSHLPAFYAVTTELSAWYATNFLLQVALLTVIAVWAFRVSLAGQKVVDPTLFE